MPNGNQEVEQRAYVAAKLRNQREKIAGLRPEVQKRVYGVAFDKTVAPTLRRSGLSEEALEQAKEHYIIGIIAPKKQVPLGEEFGKEKTEPSLLDKASSFFGGTLAGSAGIAKNLLDTTSGLYSKALSGKEPPKDAPESWLRSQLSEAERFNYELANLPGTEGYARWGAGTGKAIPQTAAFAAGEGIVPELAGGAAAPKAMKALQYLTRLGVGTAASTIPFEQTSAGDIAKQTAMNVLADRFLHGMGKMGASGAAKLLQRARGSKSPDVVGAVQLVDDLFGKVAAEKFPGKSLDTLTPAEFDSVVKESQARRADATAKEKEAEKAVKAAQKAQAGPKLSPEEKALGSAQRAEKAKAERAANKQRVEHVQKQLAEYKKRTGNLPTQDSEHWKQIVEGKTVDQILGEQKAQAVQAATGVADAKQAQTLSEGAPTAVEAVETVKQFAGEERRVTAGKPPAEGERRKTVYEMSKGKVEADAAKKAETEAKAKAAGEASKITEGEALQHIMKDTEKYAKYGLADDKEKGKMLVAAKNAIIKERVGGGKTKEPKKSLFTVDIEPIQKATTPEEFAQAKKDVMASINRQAIEQARAVGSTEEKMRIASEANREIHIVRSMEVTVGKGALESQRKSKAFAEGQETLGRAKTEAQMASPEEKLTADIDKAKEHEAWFRDNKHMDVYMKVAKEWSKIGGSTGDLNEMLDEAKATLEKK